MRSRRPCGWVLWLILLCASSPVAAHDVPPSIVMIDIGAGTLDIEMQLQLSELGAALALPLASNPSAVIPQYGAQIEHYARERLQVHSRDGRAYTLRDQTLGMRRTNDARWRSEEHI